MKKFTPLLLCIFVFILNETRAQCNFTPTITPNNPVLCPDQTDTLWTQVYDSYQWYKGNNPIDGATNQYLIVTQQHDVGFKFKVAATQDGCTAFSSSVLVDEWAFTPPDLIISGDYGQFDFRNDARVICKGTDTMFATLSEPYVLNDQWYSYGKAIAGATNETYVITKAGSYTVCGAPEVCPNYIACESLPLNVEISSPKPVVSQSHDTLYSTSSREYQWFKDDNAIDGATNRYYVPAQEGSYSVMVTNRWICSAVSAPYNFELRLASESAEAASLFASPNPASDVLHIRLVNGGGGTLLISDLQGKVLTASHVNSSEEIIPIQNIPSGMFILTWQNESSKTIARLFFMKQ